jgi:hypothetical protein
VQAYPGVNVASRDALESVILDTDGLLPDKWKSTSGHRKRLSPSERL